MSTRFVRTVLLTAIALLPLTGASRSLAAQKPVSPPAGAPRVTSQSSATQNSTSPKPAAAKLDGDWIVSYQREASVGHASAPVMTAVTARMTLHQQGGVLLGQWQTVAAPGDEPSPVYELRGQMRKDSAFVDMLPNDDDSGVLASMMHDFVDFMKEHVHGIKPMMTVLELTTRGDSLVGLRRSVSVDRTTNGASNLFTAIRAKP